MNTTHTEFIQKDIYSVSRLVRETRSILEGSFPLIWVSGEISNLAQPASGHIYFTLKDEIAQVRCAMFRMKRQRLRFRPKNGQQVMLRAKISLYEARGEFQLIAEHIEPAGEGALRLAFEQLKQKLVTEGLFDADRKKPLPAIPQQLGIITSPTGAAIRDLLTVLGRRFPALPVIIYPVQVQGGGAAQQITQMLQIANQRNECDLLILSRGGGSLEDLQAFNNEGLARQIYDSQIPVVTGIGHEVDFTIADFVADQRAPTPSAAAELVSPDQTVWLKQLQQLQQRLTISQSQHLHRLREKLGTLKSRLLQQHPNQRLQQRAQRFDELTQRLKQAQHVYLLTRQHKLEKLTSRLNRLSPQQRVKNQQQTFRQYNERLQRAIQQRLKDEQTKLSQLARDLHNLSPLNTLGRGYAIVTQNKDGSIIRTSNEVKTGDTVNARLFQGSLVCRVVRKD
ncbi:MAG: exodeoxyribonuclease VII large subunit [Candidatus Thiodiazotropha sp. (ex Lucinoma aequizonata)]|nr:exodeoxyribonuclease VII large subunit [Candidatus Thiodiazotropha sp. (ex Lucinoma aequizonata)]MCU7887491.1 exodeoxyribonuclease VII large subunit [Candidatus Thiodiazotropha sp. (ex Lucinoma aequizonata)]MCU7894938.1 exodeoxyribonuclease VII large subunit [Candidatus Thiodiazotropha sp. (ex Lucinoma aequizonata)]MCU7898328.1 exodeoxyribonuclease VII large subunit [Candidatus Thiodiazotropha sp. (ex Lucinoma aequizonata)]MCU7903983.1 exodeoxyribonuclease VII large subunit [Candidatus Thiod